MFSYSKEQQPVIAIALLTAACLVGDSMLYVVLPTHWQEAGLSSLWEVGVLLSVNRLIRLPLNPLVGWIYHRVSSRNGVLLASALAVMTTLSYGYLQGFAALLAARCIWGIAWTFLRLGGYFAIINCSENSNRGHLMGTYNGLFRLGSLAGMLLGGLLADYLGLAYTATFFACITLLAIPLGIYFVPNCKAMDGAPSASMPVSQLIRNADIVWPLTTGLIVAMLYQGVFTSTLSHLIKSHEAETVIIASFSVGAASLAGILQAIRWGWEPWAAPWFGRKSDGKQGRRPYLCFMLLLAAALFLVTPFQMPLPIWLVLLLCMQVCATALTTLSDAIASDAASLYSKAVVMTSYSFSTDLGAALGPIMAYAIGQIWGPYAVYWISSILLFILALKWVISPPIAKSDFN